MEKKKRFCLETQILFPPLNLNRITRFPCSWAPPPTLETEYVFVFISFSLLGFFFLLWFSLNGRHRCSVVGMLGESQLCLQKLPDPSRMVYPRQKEGLSSSHCRATPPEKPSSPFCEITTEKYILLTSHFRLFPLPFLPVRSGNSCDKSYHWKSSG